MKQSQEKVELAMLRGEILFFMVRNGRKDG